MPITKPEKQKDVLDMIWYGMYGTNGSNGLVKRVENVEKWTKDPEEYCPVVKEGKNKKRNKWLVIKDVVVILSILFGTGFAAGCGPKLLQAAQVILQNGGVQ